MGFNLLVAFVAARGFVQVLHLSAPSQSPLNLWLPLASHLPEACAVLCGALAAYLAWLRRAYAHGGTVWSRHSRDDVDVLRQALLDVSY